MIEIRAFSQAVSDTNRGVFAAQLRKQDELAAEHGIVRGDYVTDKKNGELYMVHAVSGKQLILITRSGTKAEASADDLREARSTWQKEATIELRSRQNL
jgi:hypothetical protein